MYSRRMSRGRSRMGGYHDLSGGATVSEEMGVDDWRVEGAYLQCRKNEEKVTT